MKNSIARNAFNIFAWIFILASMCASVLAISITPVHPVDTDPITCSFASSRAYLYTFEWYKGAANTPSYSENGYHGTAGANPYSILPESYTTGGDTWTCKVKANNNFVDSGFVNVVGQNTDTGSGPGSGIETTLVVGITPNDANKNQELTCTLTGTSRAYLYALEWFVNGKFVKTENAFKGSNTQGTSTLEVGNYKSGDDVSCRAKAIANNEYMGAPYSIKIINTAPVIQPIPTLNAVEGQLFTYTIAATDYDNDVLTYSLVMNPAIVPLPGQVINLPVLNGNILTWTPAFTVVPHPSTSLINANLFILTVSDGESNATQTITFNINDVNRLPFPTAHSYSLTSSIVPYDPLSLNIRATVFQDITLTVPAINDLDADNINYTWYNSTGVVSGPFTVASGFGPVVLNVPAPGTPAAAGSYIYRLNLTDSHVIPGRNYLQWNVTLVEDYPVVTGITAGQIFYVNEGQTLLIRYNASDLDGSAFTFGSIGAVGTVSAIAPDMGEFNFTPTPTDVLHPSNTTTHNVSLYVVESDGGLNTTVPITVIVRDVDQLPQANPLMPTALTLPEDTANTSLMNVSNWFSDADAEDNLTYSISPILSSPDVLVTVDSLTGLLGATASNNFNGLIQFKVVADDGAPWFNTAFSSVITLNITPVNDIPYMTSFNWTAGANSSNTSMNAVLAENQTFSLTVSGADIDNGDRVDSIIFTVEQFIAGAWNLILSWFGGPSDVTVVNATSGSASITHNFNFTEAGDYRVNMTMNDTFGNMSATQSWIVNVTDVPQLPRFNALMPTIFNLTEDTVDNTSIDLSNWFYSLEGQDINWTYAFTGPQDVAVSIDNATGIVTLTPAANWSGTNNITFTGYETDGGNVSSHLITLNVVNQNDAPYVVMPLPTISFNDGNSGIFNNITAYFSDPDMIYGDSLTFSLVPGSYNVNITPVETSPGVWTIQSPDQAYCGLSTMDFNATDSNGASVIGTLNIDVICENDAPIYLGGINDITLPTGTGISFSIAGNFSDPDLEALNYAYVDIIPNTNLTITVDPVTGWVTINSNANFTTPQTARINFTATDAGLLSASQAINIQPVDIIPPSITNVVLTTTATTAIITWDTISDPSDSLVKYGLVSGVYIPEYNGTAVTSHSLRLTGLSANTTYYYVINSTDIPGGNSNQTAEATFTTNTSNYGTVSGTITDAANGNLLAGALVQFKQGAAVIGQATTTSAGTYTITNLIYGDYNISVAKAGFSIDNTGSITIAPSGLYPGQDFALNAASTGSISGHVYDNVLFNPQVSRIVYLYNSARTTILQTTTSDALDGSYTFNGIPNGYAYDVVASPGLPAYGIQNDVWVFGPVGSRDLIVI